MKKIIILLLILVGCSKPDPECWKCSVRYQATDVLIEEIVFCDKTWTEIICIADSLNTYKVTYTHCCKI